MKDQIETALVDGVLTVRFNRPEKKNAITLGMYEVLASTLERARTDRSVRVILFCGAGQIFTAGNDLGDFLDGPPRGETAPSYRFISGLPRAAVPLVAAVDGPAVGIGTTMLLHCDMVLITARAKLQLPFVNLALVPEAASTYLLPRITGNTKASELLLLGQPFSGQEAYDWGIANRLCEPETLDADAHELAHQIAARPPDALRATKALMNEAKPGAGEAIEREYAAFTERLLSAEAKEAFQAFLEKRPPDFSRTG